MDPRIDELQRKAAASSDVVVLAGGLPAAELFPRTELASAFLSVVSEPRCSALQYGWPEGDPVLREHIASRLRARGADVASSDVIVTSGAQQAIGIAMQGLGSRGRRVALDRQTYPVALDMLHAAGARLVHGVEQADWVYTMPGVTNPGGTGMSPDRRAAIVASGLPIIADEAYAELRFDGRTPRPLLADAPDRTWHIGTMSKTLSPGLRVGWLIPPPRDRDAALQAKRRSDLEAGTLSQALVRTFLARDELDARLVRARAFYRRRADALVSALRRRLPSWRFAEPEGGFSIYVETDLEGSDAAFLERAMQLGASFDSGRSFLRDGAAPCVTMRLCFSQSDPAVLEEGVRRLARAATSYRPGPA